MKKKDNYFRWLFTRWYLYVLIVFHFVGVDNTFIMSTQEFIPMNFLFQLIGAFLTYGLIISMVVGIKKLLTFLFRSSAKRKKS